MKILNRPMFRMGGPIKEGIMNGIQEPRQGYQQSGMVFPRDIKRMMPNAAKVFSDVKNQYTNTFAGDKINYNPYINNNRTDGKEFLRYEGQEPIFKGSRDSNNDGIVSMKEKYMDSYKNEERISDLTNIKNRKIFEPLIAKPNTKDKFLSSRQGDYPNPDYIDPSKVNVVESYDGSTDKMPPMLDKTGKTGATNIDDVIKNRGKVDDTPLTKKERTNNILEMLGYDKAKKNALYDAMINAGQRISRTGLGAENLVSDVIQDTSTVYDKPEKLREAANLMDVQQQLKLDQIDASKTNKNQEDLDFYTKQFGGGEGGRKKALNFLTKQASSSVEAYLTTKKSTGSGLDGVKGAIEWMIGNGDIKEGENKGEINKKKFDGLSDFLKDPEGFAKRGPGVYQLSGMVVRINADGTTETVQSFGTIDEKTSSWFSK